SLPSSSTTTTSDSTVPSATSPRKTSSTAAPSPSGPSGTASWKPRDKPDASAEPPAGDRPLEPHPFSVTITTRRHVHGEPVQSRLLSAAGILRVLSRANARHP